MAYEIAGIFHEPFERLWPTPQQAAQILERDSFDTFDIEARVAVRVGDEVFAERTIKAVRCEWQTDDAFGTFVFRKPPRSPDNLATARRFLAGMAAEEDWAYDSLGEPPRLARIDSARKRIPHKCAVCGVEFVAIKTAVYCGHRCQQAAKYHRGKQTE